MSSVFTVTKEQVASILRDFRIASKAAEFTELQRSHYEKDDPDSKEVRLISKVGLENGRRLVVRFKNEEDVTLEIVDAQSRFARLLAEHGIETPMVYAANGQYARWYAINGYDVIVTVEDFVLGEVRAVGATIAEKTGGLLARMHSIAEKADFHVQNDVLFDPLKANDLFSFEDFEAQKDVLSSLDKDTSASKAATSPWCERSVLDFGSLLLESWKKVFCFFACLLDRERFTLRGDAFLAR